LKIEGCLKRNQLLPGILEGKPIFDKESQYFNKENQYLIRKINILIRRTNISIRDSHTPVADLAKASFM